MRPARILPAAWLLGITLALTAALAAPHDRLRGAGTDAPPRHPAAVAAETMFFHALNRDPSQRPAAIDALTGAYLADPADGATNLWLGMAHLWVYAEASENDPATFGHALLARHYLRRARQLRPEDGRIPSWLAPVERRIAIIEGDAEAAARAEADLLAAYADDPAFHSVSVGITRWDHPPGSPEFGQGLAAMRAALDAAPDDPSVLNRPRWPHNVEGFTLAMADYELKAGNRRGAAILLASIRERPTFDAWPFGALVDERLDTLSDRARRLADADPGNDPPYIFSHTAVSCVVCHQGRGP